MKQQMLTAGLGISCFLFFLSISRYAQAYKNYTVGDSLGWFDNLEKPNINYQKWIAGKEFSLGDFLIFNTDSNHSVVQTYNSTVYNLCDYDNAVGNDTYQWSTADPSAASPVPVTAAVPLVKVGTVYFFSGDYDGEQCENGQRFKIHVTRGQGLPESLKDPNDAMAPANPDARNEDSAPDTVVNSNFDHPNEDGEGNGGGDDDGVKKSSGADSLFGFDRRWGKGMFGILVLLGVFM